MSYIFRSLNALSIYIYYICVTIISPNRIIIRYRRRFLRFERAISFLDQERLFISFSISNILAGLVVDCRFLRFQRSSLLLDY